MTHRKTPDSHEQVRFLKFLQSEPSSQTTQYRISEKVTVRVSSGHGQLIVCIRTESGGDPAG